ncbi:zinc finger protein Xfin-like [Hetaerina americana]|uniref:zinc finger protein Xfin-like n=1 Tax=Hetaerina americana TaxID=62018 RepID=UPI003A7F3BA1
MHQMSTFDSDAPKESSYVLLQIVSENPSHSSSHIATQEIAQKFFSVSGFSSLTSEFQDLECSSHSLINKSEIISGTAENDRGLGKEDNDPGISNITTHVEIIHKSQPNPTPLKYNASKIEGRKAPGSNRILPLITSVWEDTDLLRKRHKLPKGSRKESKGKGPRSSKRAGLGSFDIDEISDEEDWLECEEKDFHGGGLHIAYSHFFMAEEGGEDREDCICGDCGAEFLTATQVAHHLHIHHHKIGVKLYQCFVCKRKRYPALAQLNRHLSNAHGIPRPELTCRTCFMELAGESEAKAHSRKHETPYTCSRCSHSHTEMRPHTSIPRFSTRFLLAEHLREVHLPKERPFPCNTCGRQFLYQFVRDLHMLRRHHGSALVCPEVRQGDSSVYGAQNPLRDRGGFGIPAISCPSGDLLTTPQISEGLGRVDTDLGGVSLLGQIEKSGRQSSHSQDSSLHLQADSSRCCSKGSSIFQDEVSLLRHVFHSHERTVQIQLLKWARDMDREDALFEELWKAYLKSSSKGNVSLVKSITNSSLGAEPNEMPSETLLAMPSELSLVGTSNTVNVSSVAQENHQGFVKCSSLLLSPDLVSSAPTTISINRTVLSSDGFTKVSIPSMAQISQCHDVSLSTNAALQAPESSTGTISQSSFVSADDHQSIPCVETKLIPVTRNSEDLLEPVAEVTGESTIGEIVGACMVDILDSICDVMDKRSALKESKKPSAPNGIQKNASSVRCVLCRYLACNPMALERHRRRRHFRNRHCPFCSLACPSVDSVWKHVSDVHLDSSNKSTAGDGQNNIAEAELQHQNQIQKSSHSSSGLRCPVCKKVFTSRGKCNNHQETVHKVEVVSRPLSCDICSKKFQFQKALERHKLLHGQSEDSGGIAGTLKCPHCDQTFLRPGFLNRHVASHFEDFRKNGSGETGNSLLGHPCPACPRRLSTPAKLKAHLRTSHPPSHLKQRFMCSQCPVRCSTASGLRVHIRVHTGERPFSCQLCDATFKRHTALKTHMLALHPVSSESPEENVTKESFVKCPNCSSLFRDRSNLVRHFLQVHRGLRRFVCGLCGSRYGQNQDLRRHLKSHHEMEAPRIIGSDRKSVDQIYVFPPVLDNLPMDDPLVDKIRMIVEEEERKLSEDNLPQFTATPQQLHVRIHKDGARNNEPMNEENHNQARNNMNVLSSTENEKVNDDWNGCFTSPSNFNESQGLKPGNEKDIVHQSQTKPSYQKFDPVAENKSACDNYYINKSSSTGSRDLILDALISSQISIEPTEGNMALTEEDAQVQNFVHSPLEMAREVEGTFPKSTEVNIIMSQGPLTSSSQFMVGNTTEDGGTTKVNEIGKSPKKASHDENGSVVFGTFLCWQCGKQFADSSRLERHCKTHKGMKPHVCSICGKGFIERFNLKVHMRSHTGERPYKCEDCGKTMRYLKELTDHRRLHLGERPFGCEICSKAFLRLRDLQRHLLIHSDEKKHKCPICGKAFSRLDHLRTAHMRVHERQRLIGSKVQKRNTDPGQISQKSIGNNKEASEKCQSKRRDGAQNQWYSCRKCAKQFSSKTKLNQHLILHSGQKEHKCSTCGRSFALLSYLRAHLNIHQKQEGYIQCPKCPRKFASEETLSVHENKFHGRIEKMKKFPSPEFKPGRSRDASTEFGDEEKFFMTRPGDFDMNLDLEDDINIQEVALFDPASLSEAERQNRFVYLRVISDDLQLTNEADLIE